MYLQEHYRLSFSCLVDTISTIASEFRGIHMWCYHGVGWVTSVIIMPGTLHVTCAKQIHIVYLKASNCMGSFIASLC